MALEAEKKEKERQERLAQMSAEKQAMIDNLDLTKPVEELPDCYPKY